VRLLRLELRDFRNHRESRADLDGRPTLLLGENGSGKTNWIEAAALLSIGRSFRGSRDRELVRRGADTFEVRATVAGGPGAPRELSVRGSLRGPRDVTVDGAPLSRMADLLGRFPSVHFSVEDVAVLNGEPSGRRRFMDVALCQLEPAYVGALRDYLAALKQRNRLLIDAARDGDPRDDECAAWEGILARSGVEIDRRRATLAGELDWRIRELAGRVDPDLAPAFGYGGAVRRDGSAGVDGADSSAGFAAADESTRAAALATSRPRDRRLGWTSIGPHRTRVECAIQGRELNDGASRGFARLYSILLRLALAGVIDERLQEAPVVLLDDPESELDPRWIGKLLALLPEGSQTIVTACRHLTSAPAGFQTMPIESLAMEGTAA
jgi:DNA replication and repair protein RecF